MGLSPIGLRVVPLLLLVTKIWLICSEICSYLTAAYFLPGCPNFSPFFLEVIQNSAAKPLPMFTLWHSWQTFLWTSPPSLLECCFLISISPWLNLSAVPNVLPVWLIGQPISSTCLSLWLLLSWVCTSPLGYLRPPWLVPWNVFVLSCFLRYLFGLWQYSWFNFLNIAYSSNFLVILLLGSHWFPGNLHTSIIFVFDIKWFVVKGKETVPHL